MNSSTPAMFGTFNLPFGCLQGVNTCNLGNVNFLIQYFGDPFPGVAKHVCLNIIYID